jgi:hypothetical protein
MQPKYAGKTIALPKELSEKLIALQKDLAGNFGFEPSLSEVVAYLFAKYKERE